MRTIRVRLAIRPIAAALFAAFFAAGLMPLTAGAQQPADGLATPPQLEKLEEGEAPEVTIRGPSQQNTITEKKAPGGKVTEVKVTSGKSTYILKANDQAGDAVVGDGQASNLRGAQWEVLEFDWGRKAADKQAQEAEAEAAEQATPVLPPAPPPAKK